MTEHVHGPDCWDRIASPHGALPLIDARLRPIGLVLGRVERGQPGAPDAEYAICPDLDHVRLRRHVAKVGVILTIGASAIAFALSFGANLKGWEFVAGLLSAASGFLAFSASGWISRYRRNATLIRRMSDAEEKFQTHQKFLRITEDL